MRTVLISNTHLGLAEAYEAADSIIVGMVTECGQSETADRWAGGGNECAFVTPEEVVQQSTPTRDYAGIELTADEASATAMTMALAASEVDETSYA